MSLIHLPFCRASWTVRFFLLECLQRFGARLFKLWPPIQFNSQKLAYCPSPIWILVDAALRSLSKSSQGVLDPIQGFSSVLHSKHSHLNRRALAFFSRFGTPRQPYQMGEQTLVQLTLHFPPCMSSLPTHMKCLLALSIYWSYCFSGFKIVRMYVGMALRTEFTPPPICSNDGFHPDSRPLILSWRGWKCTLRSWLGVSGSPR